MDLQDFGQQWTHHLLLPLGHHNSVLVSITLLGAMVTLIASTCSSTTSALKKEPQTPKFDVFRHIVSVPIQPT